MKILTKIFGDANEKYLKSIKPIIQKINDLEPKFQGFSDEELKQKTQEFKLLLKQAQSDKEVKNILDEILAQAFALVREASKRTLNQCHFDVQLIGGIALHQGKIAQMLTGEGKTLAATLAAYLNALSGNGVHIITVNDYLAKRDAVWMGQIYYLLGLSVSCIVHDAAYLYDPDYQLVNSKFQIPNSKQTPNSNDQMIKTPEKERDAERDTLGGFKVVETYLRPCTRKQAYEADITYGTNNEFGFDYLRDSMAYSLDQMVQTRRTDAELQPLRGSRKTDAENCLNFAILDEIDFILIDEARTPLIISAPDMRASTMYKQFAKIIPLFNSDTDYEIEEEKRVVTLTEQGINKLEKILKVENIYAQAAMPAGRQGISYLHHLEQALRAHVLFKKDVDYVVKDNQIIIVDEFTGRLMPGRRWSGGLHQAVEAKERVEIQPESRTLCTITFQNYFRIYKKLAGMTGTAITSAEEFDKVYNLDVICIPTNKPMIRNDLVDGVYLTKNGKIKSLIKEIKKRHVKGQPILIGTRSIEKNEVLSRFLQKQGLEHQVLNAKNHEKEGAIIAQAGKLGAITVATNMAGRGVDIILGGNPPDPDGAQKVKNLGGLHIIGTERHEARRIDDQLRGRAGRQGDPGSSQFFLCLEDELLRVFGGQGIEKMKSLMEKTKFPETEPIESNILCKTIEKAQAKIEGLHFDIRKNLLDYDNVMSKHRQVFYEKRKKILDSTLENPIKRIHLQIMDFYWIHHLEDMKWLRDSVRLKSFGKIDPLVAYKTQGYEIFQDMMSEIKQKTNEILLALEQGVVQSTSSGRAINTARPSRAEKPGRAEKAGRNDPCPCGKINPKTKQPMKYKKCCWPKYG